MKAIPASVVVPGHPDYADLAAIGAEISKLLSPTGGLKAQFPLLVRDAMDFVLDSVRTARTRLSDLDNVEKTFIGLKLEHFVRDMLDVPKGLRDLEICGKDVDIKNTVNENWSIPQETYKNSEPCLLMAVAEDKHTCFLGLIIAKPEYLHGGKGNRDTKKGVNAAGFKHIMWMLKDEPFPSSKFLGLDMDRFRELRNDIKGGSERASNFFRENLRRVIHRDVAHALLFDQSDYMKRLRANGGAPDKLMDEEIAILIGTYLKERDLAARLGVPNLKGDEIVALAPRDAAERALMKAEGVIA